MNNNTGFTLIEVLIAMMILAVGLLGLAALQATSLRNNQSAFYYSQATQLAYDIADRMRANVASAATYTVAGNANPHDNCLAIEGCTPAEMAEHDLYEWYKAIQSTFPESVDTVSKIEVNTVGGIDTYTVTISWNDNRDDDVDGHPGILQGDEKGDSDGDGDSDNDPYFQMDFRI
ncbi:Type IV pilus modification protein PilV [Crenothrix polyspora]|uniref:Type IV pilus modification protein PilV n=1 Tax=Crenothrix polyspora TaxID=360316 RepID=A0A1R4H2Q3_9GAMM|nr:type IV pilus modification protein PilV [Crenothrix polyspora]SJM90508.1 Type IV pilus modification protein PilV [Crenothrix polyspora]